MKPIDYVNKYKVEGFSLESLSNDLIIEFTSLLEVGKSTENIKGFDNASRALKMKFDAINKLYLNNIPSSFWNNIQKNVIDKMRFELFPEKVKIELERKRRDEEDRKRWDERRKRESESFSGNLFDRLAWLYLMMNRVQIPHSAFLQLDLNPNDATEELVNSQYRQLSKKKHPDLGGSHNEFIELTEAKNRCLTYLKSK